jgi:opacity protein-like surface antigen
MANATGIIPDTGWWAEPYVGLGLGYARWDHNNTIAGQVIGGFEKHFELPEWANNTAMAAAVEYKHLWVNENGGKQNNTSKMNSDTVMFKLKYLF